MVSFTHYKCFLGAGMQSTRQINIQVFLILNRLFNNPVVYSKKLRTEIQSKFSYRKIYKQVYKYHLKNPSQMVAVFNSLTSQNIHQGWGFCPDDLKPCFGLGYLQFSTLHMQQEPAHL